MAGKLKPEIQAKFWLKFTNWCHQAVVLGYQQIKDNGIEYKEWEEEDISAALYTEIEQLPIIKSKQITVIPEFRLYNKDIALGKKSAKKADRIDFRFNKWRGKNDTKYYGEAKNLSSKNWKKVKDTKVDASAYRARYIETGIDRVSFGKYSFLNNFLIGYVVNGTANENIVKLNSLINKRNLPPKIGIIEKDEPICSYSKCYCSTNINNNEKVILQHVLLEFDKL